MENPLASGILREMNCCKEHSGKSSYVIFKKDILLKTLPEKVDTKEWVFKHECDNLVVFQQRMGIKRMYVIKNLKPKEDVTNHTDKIDSSDKTGSEQEKQEGEIGASSGREAVEED